MKFSVLALDYDGTIARDGVLDPEVRAAVAEVRDQEITAVIGCIPRSSALIESSQKGIHRKLGCEGDFLAKPHACPAIRRGGYLRRIVNDE